MSINTISDFFLVSTEDGTQVSYEVYQTREAAQARIDRVPEEVRAEIAIKELCIPADFLAVVSDRSDLRDTVTKFCWFGSRIVAEGPHYVIVGASKQYSESQSLRLHSGLWGNSKWPTLEQAEKHAQSLVRTMARTCKSYE